MEVLAIVSKALSIELSTLSTRLLWMCVLGVCALVLNSGRSNAMHDSGRAPYRMHFERLQRGKTQPSGEHTGRGRYSRRILTFRRIVEIRSHRSQGIDCQATQTGRTIRG